MGILCDYFAAATDEEAAGLVEHGPVSGSEAGTTIGTRKYRTVSAKGVMPPVQTGTLQTILVGESPEEPAEDPENGRLVVGEEHGPWVVTVTDTLRDALAAADEAQLLWVAGPWAETEELAADGWTAEDALGVLVELASLARHAVSENLRLYCWICL